MYVFLKKISPETYKTVPTYDSEASVHRYVTRGRAHLRSIRSATQRANVEPDPDSNRFALYSLALSPSVVSAY